MKNLKYIAVILSVLFLNLAAVNPETGTEKGSGGRFYNARAHIEYGTHNSPE